MPNHVAYVYSTASSDNRYTNWIKGGGDLPVRGDSVLIKGGANVIGKNLVTPRGVCTPVTAEELKILESNKTFARHKSRGFVSVEKIRTKAEKVAANMQAKDASAQKTASDFTKAPTTSDSKPQ